MLYDKPELKKQYENYIGGKWTAPLDGKYFENITPISNEVFTKIPRSNDKDIELAIDAAEKAEKGWADTSVIERSNILLRIADRIEQNIELLARVETFENGKSIRETLAADIPLSVDQFRYFASAARSESGEANDIDSNTVSLEVYEPLGVIGQIIPWNFPILMACWKLAPALATGNCVVLKPAEQTPASVLVLMELIEDLIPPGVINIVNGFGIEAGKPLAQSPRIKKIAFTGETTTGQLILEYASQNIIPVTLELGGKSPNIFFESVMSGDEEFLDKAVEGCVMFALNQGEVCTCPSRALIQESIYDKFIEKVIERVKKIKVGNPFDDETMMGAQASNEQHVKIKSYLDTGKKEGAEVLTGGDIAKVSEYPEGFYIQPTVFKGDNSMRIFQEEIFGPVLSVTTFKDQDEAMAIANDTPYGLGAGVWTKDIHQAQAFAKGIHAGRVWVNCYHLYPSHASFGGFKKSGIGREGHKMMMNHYRRTKNVIMSFDKKAMGFF